MSNFQENCDKLNCILQEKMDKILDKSHHITLSIKFEGFYLGVARKGDKWAVCYKLDVSPPSKQDWVNPQHCTIETKIDICNALDRFNTRYTKALEEQERTLEAFVNGKQTV